MEWTISLPECIARARTDLRLGLPVGLRGSDGDVLILAVDGLREDAFAAMKAAGDPYVAITQRRAETLKVRAYDTDLARIAMPADATVAWAMSVADPSGDMSTPMKGPFASIRDGQADAARLGLMLAKSARLLPAIVVLENGTVPAGLTVLEAAGSEAALLAPVHHQDVVSGHVPLAVSQAGRVHVFRPEDGGEDHVVCEIGKPSRAEPVLVRLHSACFTGDVLGSLKCDCGAQLGAAMAQMGAGGEGVLLYLSQEGRGIGLANKLRAYALQDQGFDTVEANHRLGFEDDERDFRTGADLLKRLGFSAIRLMTNNPAKVGMMEAQGIEVVERVPLAVGRRSENSAYLDTKARKSGHLL